VTARPTPTPARLPTRPARAVLAIASASLLTGSGLTGCNLTPAPAGGAAAQPQRLREGYALMNQAARAERAGRADDAIRLYREALAVAPELSGAWNNLGVLYMQADERPAAAECFRRAADLSPSDPRPLANLGLLYDDARYGEDAVRYYAEALERDPNYLDALRGGVKAAARLGRRDARTLDWTERGLLIEKDPTWLEIFQRQRISIRAELQKSNKAGA